MSEPHLFECRLHWTGAEQGPTRSYEGYSREYKVEFDGKSPLHGTAAPQFLGDGSLHNPEDMLVAALSACHCLSYLAICSRSEVVVTAYEDRAVGTMRVVDRVLRFSDVLLRPRVTVAAGMDVDRARRIHDKAHHECFIAASVNFPVRNEPTIVVAGD
jgi:organic hydroperoxide reductase OsmC/OhrA